MFAVVTGPREEAVGRGVERVGPTRSVRGEERGVEATKNNDSAQRGIRSTETVESPVLCSKRNIVILSAKGWRCL